MSETLGTRVGGLHYHATENVKFSTKIVEGGRMVGISPKWDYQYLKDHPPRMISLFPNFTRTSDGTLRTMIQVKNGKFTWYGRPDWTGSWLYIYREYQDATYLLKKGNRQWMADIFLEMEGGDIENDDPFDEAGAIDMGFEGAGDRVNQNFSSQSPFPNPIWMTTRPSGSSPAFIHEFKPDLQEGFFEKMDQINRKKIIEANSWSERLLGSAVSEGFSTNTFLQELKIKEPSVLKTYRGAVEYALNRGIAIIAEWTGDEQFMTYQLKYRNAFETMSEQKGDLKTFLDSIGVAVRAGAFTPTLDDETTIREMMNLPINENVVESWAEDGGFRRPITLKGDESSQERQEAIERGEDVDSPNEINED